MLHVIPVLHVSDADLVSGRRIVCDLGQDLCLDQLGTGRDRMLLPHLRGKDSRHRAVICLRRWVSAGPDDRSTCQVQVRRSWTVQPPRGLAETAVTDPPWRLVRRRLRQAKPRSIWCRLHAASRRSWSAAMAGWHCACCRG